MRLLGIEITRRKAAGTLNPVDNRGGWWPWIRESYPGAFQENVEVKLDSVLAYFAVYRCISLISSDIAKMRLRLVAQDSNGIWVETENTAYSPVLRKPNHYQNRIQYYQCWVQSKLINGNTYALKQRDGRGVVVAKHILDPRRVTPLVAPDGSVFYQLSQDNLAGITEASVTVPAREIIHDRWNTIFHPLVGVSPIFACGLAATQGLKIQNSSASFFGNGARPSGILTAPGAISNETAQRLKEHWEANYTGQNVGKVAVLGDNLKYEPMTMSAKDAELIEQLKWTAEVVCAVFGVPAYMAGVGSPPAYNNIEALGQQYYAQCLQIHIESIELCLDEGLELAKPFGTEFDLDDLLRMDSATMVKAEAEAVGAGIKKPDEARKRLNLPPVPGGDTPYMQEQNWPLAMLEARELPARPPTAPEPLPTVEPPDDEADTARAFMAITKRWDMETADA